MRYRWVRATVLAGSVLLGGWMPAGVVTARAAETSSQTASATSGAQQQQPVPVVVDGKTVIDVGWGYGTFSPEARAQGIADRLTAAAKNKWLPAEATVRQTPLSLDVMVGDQVIASVFDGDAQAAGTSRELVAGAWRTAFSKAIVDYRREHTRGRLIWRVVLSVVVVVVALVVLWLLLVASRWTADRLTAWVLGRMEASRRHELSLIDKQELGSLIRLGVRTVRLGLQVFALYLMFHALLSVFPTTRPIGDQMLHGVLTPAQQFEQAVWKSTPSLIFIVVIAVACRYLLHLVSFAFTQIREGRVRIDGFKPRWAQVTHRLVSVLIVMLAVMIAYPYIPGSQTAAFRGFSLFLGVLVSLGSTGVVSNVFNGIVLTYMDSFAVGDFIQIGETSGYVQSMSLFVTKLRTRQGRVVTIPNAQVLSSQITNYNTVAGEKMMSLSATVGIGYDTPWRQVEAMLLDAAKSTPSVRETPPPFVLQVSLNSFDITYELTVFLTGEMEIDEARALLNRNILDAFNKYGVQIMTPAYMSDPPKPAVVAKEHWYAPPAEKNKGETP